MANSTVRFSISSQYTSVQFAPVSGLQGEQERSDLEGGLISCTSWITWDNHMKQSSASSKRKWSSFIGSPSYPSQQKGRTHEVLCSRAHRCRNASMPRPPTSDGTHFRELNDDNPASSNVVLPSLRDWPQCSLWQAKLLDRVAAVDHHIGSNSRQKRIVKSWLSRIVRADQERETWCDGLAAGPKSNSVAAGS